MKKLLISLGAVILMTGCASTTETESSENTEATATDESTDSTTEADSTNDKLQVYTTIYPIEYICEYLLDDNADVYTLLSPGADAHTYEPTQQQLMDVYDSDFYAYLGLGLEQAADEVNSAMDGSDVVTLEVGNHLDIDLLDDGTTEVSVHDHNGDIDADHDHNNDAVEDDHDHEVNHHIWLDPINMISMAEVIKDTLNENYPEYADEVNANFVDFSADMEDLDAIFYERLSSPDLVRDSYIVSHDAFSYYDKYGINSIPVKDESHSKDPTQQEIQSIIEQGEALDIKTVLYEQNLPCLPLDIIAEELGAEKGIISNLSTRTDEDIANDMDYIDLSMVNMDMLEKVLSE